MTTRNLDKIFRPRRIALMGAADEPHNLGLRVLNNILNAEFKFKGVVYPIDAKHEAIRGIPTFADLASLPRTPDLALVCTPADRVPGIVEACGNAGVRGVLIFSTGFRETGAMGKALERRIAEVASKFEGLRILGPNSLGVIAPRYGLNASNAIACPKPGHLAFVSQSKALCNSVMDWADEQGIGFSFFVSIGNMLDIGFGDLIDYFNRDPGTRAIILYLQSIEHARSFMSAARAFARVKPIIAYKAGRFSASAAAAASHTGMMVAEDAVYDAAFERAGVVRVEELDDVFDAAELLASKRFPLGPSLAVVSNAGGQAVVATDALLARHGSLAELDRDTLAQLEAILPNFGSPKNPVDLLENASPTLYSRVIPIVCKDRNVDAVLVIFAAEFTSDPLATAKVVADVAEHAAKPVLAAWMGGKRARAGLQLLNKTGMAAHSTPEQAIRAFMHLVSYSRNLKTLYETPRSIPVRFNLNRNKLRKKLAPLFKKHPGYLTEDEAKTFLKAYDIPVVTGAMAQSPAEAVELADRIGYPIVVKVISPDIVHRVEVGGVALNIGNANQVYSASRQILQAVKSKCPDAKIKGIAVQKMLARHNGLELILGAKKDPTFGAVIMVGSGGVTTAVLQDRALGLPPLNERLARRMLESLRAWPILQGYRGKPAANLEHLIEIIIRFSCLITDYPEIREFDINPLLVTPEGYPLKAGQNAVLAAVF